MPAPAAAESGITRVTTAGGDRGETSLADGTRISKLDARVEAIGPAELGEVPAETLRELDTLLDMRERVAQAPAWPFDLAGVRRILLYAVLPPFTWAAAALVEILIDRLL